MIKRYFFNHYKRNFSIASIWIEGGSNKDSLGKRGINKILCSLLTRGCEGFDNLELSEFIETPVWSDTVQYYCSRVPKEHRDSLIDYLADKKIHTSVHYKPLYKYELLKQDRNYPISDVEWLRVISLPCHAGMNDDDIDYVIYWVNKYFESV